MIIIGQQQIIFADNANIFFTVHYGKMCYLVIIHQSEGPDKLYHADAGREDFEIVILLLTWIAAPLFISTKDLN